MPWGPMRCARAARRAAKVEGFMARVSWVVGGWNGHVRLELLQPLRCADVGPTASVKRSADPALRHGGTQQRCQRRLGALRIAHRNIGPRRHEQRLAVQANGGVGPARRVWLCVRQCIGRSVCRSVWRCGAGWQVECQPGGAIQPKVAARVVLRVGHQPQVGQHGALLKVVHCLGAKDKVWRVHVPGQHPKHLVQPGQRAADATGCLQRKAKVAPLMGIAQRATKVLLDLVAQPGGVGHHLADAASGQRLQVPLQQGLAVHAQQGLGQVVGEGRMRSPRPAASSMARAGAPAACGVRASVAAVGSGMGL